MVSIRIKCWNSCSVPNVVNNTENERNKNQEIIIIINHQQSDVQLTVYTSCIVRIVNNGQNRDGSSLFCYPTLSVDIWFSFPLSWRVNVNANWNLKVRILGCYRHFITDWAYFPDCVALKATWNSFSRLLYCLWYIVGLIKARNSIIVIINIAIITV